MCHERLSFDFGENMNFVIGHNGSESAEESIQSIWPADVILVHYAS